MYFSTQNYTRITCSKCNKEVAVLLPGDDFGQIPICDCFVVAPTVVGLKELPPRTFTIAQLKEMCDKEGIEYNSRPTIAQLKEKLGL